MVARWRKFCAETVALVRLERAAGPGPFIVWIGAVVLGVAMVAAGLAMAAAGVFPFFLAIWAAIRNL